MHYASRSIKYVLRITLLCITPYVVLSTYYVLRIMHYALRYYVLRFYVLQITLHDITYYVLRLTLIRIPHYASSITHHVRVFRNKRITHYALR